MTKSGGLKKAVWISLALFTGASLAFAAPVRLRVQGLPNSASTLPADVAMQRIVAAFSAEHPGIEVIPAEGISIETLNPEATTVMMVAGGIAPDVIRMNFRSMDSFVQQGIVAPLDDFVAAEPGGAALLDAILPQFRDVIFRADRSGRKRLFGLPTGLLVMGVYYNREIFRQAGLPERAPADWEELAAFAAKIKALDAGYNPLFLGSGSAASWYLTGFLWSAGGDVVREVSPGEWRAVFDTDEAVAAFAFYYRLVEIDRLSKRSARRPENHELDRVGMMFRYVGDTVNFDPEIWGFGAMPVGPGGKRGAEINAAILGIYSGITDERVRKAAWEYIKFVTGERAERIRVDALIEQGQASQINPVLLRKLGYDQYLALTPPGLEQEFLASLTDGHPEPHGRNCNLVYTEMSDPIDQILLDPKIREDWRAGDRPAVFAQIKAILQSAVQKTNERMIGYVAPEEMARRRKVAAVVVAAIAVVFVVVGVYLYRIFARAGRRLRRPTGSRAWLPWLCLLPAAGLLLTWSYVPLIKGTGMAFLDYKIILESTFVGLDNFANVLFDGSFWNSLLATAHYAAWMLTVGFLAPILLAYALHLIPKHKIFFRVLYYLPAVISATAVFFLWRELFDTDGFLNSLLRAAGFEALRSWPEDPHLAMLSCVIPGIWAGAGPGCLIYLAALKTIPEEQFEASEIDGAGFWHKTTKIVFPGLKALIAINFIGAVAAAFHGATNILIMTGGGPNSMTEVASLLIFYEAFARLRFGPATAMAWILGSILIGFTVLQLKKLSEMEFKTAR